MLQESIESLDRSDVGKSSETVGTTRAATTRSSARNAECHMGRAVPGPARTGQARRRRAEQQSPRPRRAVVAARRAGSTTLRRPLKTADVSHWRAAQHGRCGGGVAGVEGVLRGLVTVDWDRFRDGGRALYHVGPVGCCGRPRRDALHFDVEAELAVVVSAPAVHCLADCQVGVSRAARDHWPRPSPAWVAVQPATGHILRGLHVPGRRGPPIALGQQRVACVRPQHMDCYPWPFGTLVLRAGPGRAGRAQGGSAIFAGSPAWGSR